VVSLGQLRRVASLTPVASAGAADRVEEGFFRLRHRTGGPSETTTADTHATIAASISEGLEFLERTQRSHGLWRGFMLMPGASTDWISAHVALLLEDVPETHALRERVARGLLAHAAGRPGWGYNGRVGIDSDSSAQAIMVLHRFDHAIVPAWIERLLSTRCEDGGFATFASTRPDGRPRTWWEMPHTDVTLMVIEALSRLDGYGEERDAALAWLSSQLRDGVLPAYWWTSAAYSLWAQGRAGFELETTARRATELLADEQRPVYLAMLISAALAHGGWSAPLDAAVARLVHERRRDGSWCCAPCLRTTRANHPGGFNAPGPTYADRYRAFSTAHAVAALSLASRVLEQSLSA
jgi:hypothetical protein